MFDIRTKNKKNKLNNICLNAEKLLENDNELDTHTIYMIIKALTNLEYNKEIYDTLSNEKKHKPVIKFYDLFPTSDYLYKKDGKSITFLDIMYSNQLPIYETVKLGYDPVYACPWNTERLINNMNNITGLWKQDENHDPLLFLPYGITIINSGNHSATVGYLRNQGQLNVDKVYNISEVHRYVYTDGIYYYRKSDNSICSKVKNFNFAIIFALDELIYNSSKKIKFHGIEVN